MKIKRTKEVQTKISASGSVHPSSTVLHHQCLRKIIVPNITHLTDQEKVTVGLELFKAKRHTFNQTTKKTCQNDTSFG